MAQALADDLDIHVLIFRDFGKDKVKKCRVSPDAFIQIALQLAYYRVSLPPVSLPQLQKYSVSLYLLEFMHPIVGLCFCFRTGGDSV